jgi:hypothetical protein
MKFSSVFQRDVISMNISVACATGSIVNITLLPIELNCEKKSQICFKLISNDKNYSYFNISPTHLRFKNYKITPKKHKQTTFFMYSYLLGKSRVLKHNPYERDVNYA